MQREKNQFNVSQILQNSSADRITVKVSLLDPKTFCRSIYFLGTWFPGSTTFCTSAPAYQIDLFFKTILSNQILICLGTWFQRFPSFCSPESSGYPLNSTVLGLAIFKN